MHNDNQDTNNTNYSYKLKFTSYTNTRTMLQDTNKKLVFLTLTSAKLSFTLPEHKPLRIATPAIKYYAILQYVTKSTSAQDIIKHRHLFRTARKETFNIGKNIVTWDHKYRPFQYSNHGDIVKIRIHYDDGSDKADETNLMGMLQLSVDDDLIKSFNKKVDPMKFDLKSPNGETTGFVTLKCTISKAQMQQNLSITDKHNSELKNITTVHPDMFVTPIQPISVSGGTAAFYKLKFRKPDSFHHAQYLLKNSTDYYIGKDLLHAVDEVEFYEDILKIRKLCQEGNESVNSLHELMNFSLEYIGILSSPDGDELKHLLVLRNLYDRCKRLRLLDFKIGQYTASSGW